MISNTFRLPLFTVLALLLLLACSSLPGNERPGQTTDDLSKVIDSRAVTSGVHDDSGMLPAPPAFRQIQQLLAAQRYHQASEMLTAIDTSRLPPDDRVVHALLTKRILEADNHYTAVLKLMREPELQAALVRSGARIRVQYAREAADILLTTGNYLEGVKELLQVLESGDAERPSPALLARIWSGLRRAEPVSFEQTRADSDDYHLRGWLELASIGRSRSTNLEQMAIAVELWTTNWKNHRAQSVARALATQFRMAMEDQPRHIALLLPLTGRLATTGQAIRDGFLAEHFTNLAGGAAAPRLTILDTATGQAASDLYLQAETLGADLVIGPLLKTNVEQLRQSASRRTPVLALNWLSGTSSAINFYQLSLAPEDETRQLVSVANYRSPGNALVIRPEGSWGDKVAESVESEWLALGNSAPAHAVYGRQADMSTAIKQALDIGESENRFRALTRILGFTSEFTPRRRQDIDTVFLLAGRPEQARTIRPLLAFHYAGDIPVYSISSGNHTRASRTQKRDLEGLIFTDIPWILQPNDKTRIALTTSGQILGSQSRMYALGADAYALHARLGLLDQPYQRVFRGQTGNLELGKYNRLHRELLIATIRNGQIQLEAAAPARPEH